MPYGITQCYLPPAAEVTFPPLPQPKLVLDLATPEGCKAELTHNRALWHIRHRLTMNAAMVIAQRLVTARRDYSNGLLLGTTARNLDQLHVVQNALVRAVCQAPSSFIATDLRRSLHWLPIRQRTDCHDYIQSQTDQNTSLHGIIDHLTSYCYLPLLLASSQ